MRFLLVVPIFVRYVGEHYSFPVGLGYISSALKRAGHEVYILNLNHISGDVAENVGRAIRETDPQAFCTGGLTQNYPVVKGILKVARAAKPGMRLIVGGGLLSSLPEIVLNGVDADIGVIGEGELAMTELAEALEGKRALAGVNGLIYREGEKLVRTPERAPVGDLDALPWPDYEGLGMDFYLDMQMPLDAYYLNVRDKPRGASLITTRSCPFNCTFCYHPLGHVYRERKLDEVFKEIEHLVGRYHINLLTIYDELFAVNRARMVEFCARIKRYGIGWLAQLRVDTVTKELLELMKDSGCYSVGYGIESLSPEILKSMNKKTTPEMVDRALKLTYDANLDFQGNILFGDSAETMKNAEITLNWWFNNLKYVVALSVVDVFPGSPIWDYGVKKGVIKDPLVHLENNQYRINTSNLDEQTYTGLLYLGDLYQFTLCYTGKCLGISAQPPDKIRGAVYTVRAQCPHCFKVVEYPNTTDEVVKRPYVRVICKQCLHRFHIPFPIPEPCNEAKDLFTAAEEFKKEGRLDEALQSYMSALNKTPGYAAALNAACALLYRDGRKAEALSLCYIALRMNPMDFRVNTEFANAALECGNYNLAVNYLKQLIRLS